MVWHDFDMMELLKYINDAFDMSKPLHNDKKVEAQERLITIADAAKNAMKLIDHFTGEDKNHIFHEKYDALLEVHKRFHDLRARAEYYQTHGPADFAVLKESFANVKKELDRYADMGGSVYLFRHCAKEKHARINSGEMVVGIPKHAMRSEAYEGAEMILNEILMSPRPVEVYFYCSEEFRTDLFARIVKQHAELANKLTQHNVGFEKATFKNKGFDDRIKFGHFTDDALKEIDSYYNEKGGDEAFLCWFEQREPVKSMKHQPSVPTVIHAVEDFMREGMRHASDTGTYRIVLGFSHSGVIDALLFHKFPSLLRHYRKVIKTGAYCKAECHHLEYQRDWTSL